MDGGNMLDDQPKILVFASPNGSGKTTITVGYPIIGVYVNADDIKLHRGCSEIILKKDADGEIYLPNDFWDEDKLRKLLTTSP